MNTTCSEVFVSYSHADKKWLERILKHLKPVLRREPTAIWWDGKLMAGQMWREEIDRALSSAKVGVLLVSANFLDSDFIANKELPYLLAAARERQVKLIAILLSNCSYHELGLGEFQFVNPLTKPLERMRGGNLSDLLVSISKNIAQELETKLICPEASSSIGNSQNPHSAVSGHSNGLAKYVPKIWDRQYEELNAVVSLFERKTEIQLREDTGLEDTFLINWMEVFDAYAYYKFNLIPKNPEQRPYNLAGSQVIPIDKFRKHFVPSKSHLLPENSSELKKKVTARVRLTSWSQYEFVGIALSDQTAEYLKKLDQFCLSAYLPKEIISIVNAYRDLVNENIYIIDTIITKAAKELPRKYPDEQRLRRASDAWVIARYKDKIDGLEPLALKLVQSIRRYIGIDSI